MWFFAITFIVMIFIAFRYVYITIDSYKLKNLELVRQAGTINDQLDILTEKENKARREADIAYNAKSKLLSMLSHEIRTPMNGVIGMSTLLAETELSKEQREYADTILDCSKKLLTNVNEILINDMLHLSKIDVENAEVENKSFSLQNCIEEVLDMFARKAAEQHLNLLYQINPGVPLQIEGDYKRLQQVLINLVENAVKFTDKGEIFIGVELIENLEQNKLRLGFTVRDTGKGISAEELQQIFNPALPEDYSTKNKEISKGFGLLICKRLINTMNGQIKVDTKIGEGCVFTFDIIAGCAEAAAERRTGLEGKQILVIDSNESSLNVLSAQLEQWKLLPSIAASGNQAMDILSQVSVDVILIDLLMPGGTDGIILSQLIRQKYPKVPVILMNQVNDERCKAYPEVFNDSINKPVKRDRLFDSITNQLRNEQLNGSFNQIPENFSDKYPLRILVAEDNAVNQKWISKILSKIGYKCEIAENGRVVLETVSDRNFDLIFMDVQMPEMDGMEATRMIRVCLEVQPVIIAMTANALQGDREACIQSGMNDYISKPVELPVLINMLEKWGRVVKEKKELKQEKIT